MAKALDLFKIENLVLWARSEKFCYAVNQGRGMLEYWNAGILGLAEWDLFLHRWHESEHKIGLSSAFDFHDSIIPLFRWG